MANISITKSRRQMQFDRAMNIAIDVVRRAQEGNKTCMQILKDAGILERHNGEQ
jgi:hypothetical protein